MSVSNLAPIQARLDSFRRADQERDDWISQVVRHYAELSRKCENQDMQLGTIIKSIAKHSYVLALIDGDGSPFADRLVQNHTDGGALAAYHLEKEIKAYIRSLPFGQLGDLKIRVQIFLNVDGLRRKLFASRILTDVDFYNFVRQFNMHSHSFNIIDVGHGKEHADHKLRDIFSDHLDNPLCKHIIFAGCHDNGYLAFLRQYQYDEEITKRVSLLFTSSTQEAYKAMREFQHIEFKTVFRDEPLPERPAVPVVPTVPLAPPTPASPKLIDIIPRTNSAGLDSQTNGIHHVNGGTLSAMAASFPKMAPKPDAPQRTSTPSTNQSSPKLPLASPPAASSNWSTVATRGKPSATIDIAPAAPAAPEPAKKYLLLNLQRQRLDPPISRPPQADWDAYNALRARNGSRNLCNDWYLNSRCTNASCGYEHDARLTDGVLAVLRYMARRLPCVNGLACDQVSCYLGHSCVYAPNCSKMNSDCRFPREMHVMNTTPAYRVNADGVIQSV